MAQGCSNSFVFFKEVEQAVLGIELDNGARNVCVSDSGEQLQNVVHAYCCKSVIGSSWK